MVPYLLLSVVFAAHFDCAQARITFFVLQFVGRFCCFSQRVCV